MNFGGRVGVTDGYTPLGGLTTESHHTTGKSSDFRDAQGIQRLRVEVDHGSMLARGDFDENMCQGHFEKDGCCCWMMKWVIQG